MISLAVSSYADETTCLEGATKIEEKLECLEGVQSKYLTELQGAKVFEIQIEQPTNHFGREGEKFYQKLILHHKNEAEPMVLQTSGYSIFGISQAAITRLFGANQIQVEHRFFSTSTPDSKDWKYLNIQQSAADFHRIVTVFKKIYKAKWLNTGASKGGMTSIYHRRFYPDDIDVTIADVAPLSFSTRDQRYNIFIESVGSDQYSQCREDLKSLQKDLLIHRDELVPHLGGVYKKLGGPDAAYEHAVMELSFAFWQYGNPKDTLYGCSKIPVNGSIIEKFSYMTAVNDATSYADDGLEKFVSYYFQAATQLGSPDTFTAHLEKYRKYDYDIDQYTPENVSYNYSNAAMLDVEEWVRNEADKVIFVYGEFDPWTAGEFPVSEAGKQVHKFVVAGGNHGAKFNLLNNTDKSQVVALVSKWLEKAPAAEIESQKFKNVFQEETLEDIEFRARKKIKFY